MATEKSVYKFYTDPGHGWPAVKRTELAQFGIEGEISNYSYCKGNTVYLEEDCDATLFVDVYKEKFGKLPTWINKNSDRMSPIRNYDRYTKE